MDDYKPTRMMELTLGYEKQLTNDLKVSAMYAYKKEYNFPWTRTYWGTLDNYTLRPIETSYLAGKDATTGWEIWLATPTGTGAGQLAAANGNAYTTYKHYYNYFNGFQFIVNKKLSNKWMFNASLDLQSWKTA